MNYFSNILLRAAVFDRQATPLDTSNLVPTALNDRFPTSSLQQGAYTIIFLFTSLALVVLGLRVYIRQRMKQFGWGMHWSLWATSSVGFLVGF